MVDCPEWNCQVLGHSRHSNNYTNLQIDGLVHERHNSSAVAMELRLSCTDPLSCFLQIQGSQSSLVMTNSCVSVPLPVSCIPFNTFPLELGASEMFNASTSFVLKKFGCLLCSVKCHTDKHMFYKRPFIPSSEQLCSGSYLWWLHDTDIWFLH